VNIIAYIFIVLLVKFYCELRSCNAIAINIQVPTLVGACSNVLEDKHNGIEINDVRLMRQQAHRKVLSLSL